MENNDNLEIIERLQHMPDLEPPADLVQRVMQNTARKKKSGIQDLLSFLLTPRPVHFRPATVLALSCALVLIINVVPVRKKAPSTTVPEQAESLAESVQGAEASFLIGRGFMEAGMENKALPLLQKASLAQPDNPQFAYWEGLCFWANGMKKQERSSYLRGIEAAPDALPLRLNLAHSYLESNDFQSALRHYEEVLAIAPENQTALYNRALIFHLQKEHDQEKKAWIEYLQHNRFGSQAFRAVQYLNNLGDFTFRTYNLGKRKAIVNQRALLGLDSTEEFIQNAEILAQALRHDPALSLEIISFNEKDGEHAKTKAMDLKQYITGNIGKNDTDRISLSWFGESEQIATSAGKNEQQAESLLIFARPNNQPNMETRI